MVVPPRAIVLAAPSADLRATTDEHAELVDQAQWMTTVRVLGPHDRWRYVQSEDHYFGWVGAADIDELSIYGAQRMIAVPLAAVFAQKDPSSQVIGRVPLGAPLPAQRHLVQKGDQRVEIPPPETGPWIEVQFVDPQGPSRRRAGWVAAEDTVLTSELPHRYPTADDLVATAHAFLGVPYLWGGNTALGMDCSGFVQQVYRLNGVRLDRDAHQQAVEGRSVDVPARGDLVFFGETAITHVGIALDEHTFLNAPESGKQVQLDDLRTGRNVLAIRRYLP